MVAAPKFLLPENSERQTLLSSLGIFNEEPLLIATVAIVEKARKERPTLPDWYPLGARVAEGIATLRETLEAHGGWVRAKTSRGLHGVQQLETGLFIAVHNTCERTGLYGALPRFISPRKRTATKSLRDDLQVDMNELSSEFDFVNVGEVQNEQALHLCVYIQSHVNDESALEFETRAELIVGASCSDIGFIACRYRLPLDVGTASELTTVNQLRDKNDAAEVDFAISRKK